MIIKIKMTIFLTFYYDLNTCASSDYVSDSKTKKKCPLEDLTPGLYSGAGFSGTLKRLYYVRLELECYYQVQKLFYEWSVWNSSTLIHQGETCSSNRGPLSSRSSYIRTRELLRYWGKLICSFTTTFTREQVEFKIDLTFFGFGMRHTIMKSGSRSS